MKNFFPMRRGIVPSDVLYQDGGVTLGESYWSAASLIATGSAPVLAVTTTFCDGSKMAGSHKL